MVNRIPANAIASKNLAALFEMDTASLNALAAGGILRHYPGRPAAFELLPSVKDYIRHLRGGDYDVTAEKLAE